MGKLATLARCRKPNLSTQLYTGRTMAQPAGQQVQARATAILHARGAESILQAQHVPCQHACASPSCASAALMLAPLIAGVPTVTLRNHRRMRSPTELKREARRRHCCCHRLAFGALLRHVAACARNRPPQGAAHRVRIKAASSFPFDFYFVLVGHRPI